MAPIKDKIAILELARGIQVLSKKALTEHKREFGNIIDSGCQDKDRIEHALDGMLDFCFDSKMLELYRKLCRFYYDIDRDAAIRYVHYCRDMWDPEEKKEWVKGKSIRTKI